MTTIDELNIDDIVTVYREISINEITNPKIDISNIDIPYSGLKPYKYKGTMRGDVIESNYNNYISNNKTYVILEDYNGNKLPIEITKFDTLVKEDIIQLN